MSPSFRFVPIKPEHGERMPWERVTHVRLLGRPADTPKAQESLDHIRAFADEHGVAAFAEIEPGFPGRQLKQKGRRGAMRFDLRHFANDRQSGSSERDKGLIELGYLEKQENVEMTSEAPDMPSVLNLILFGPPGTGKTYATIEAALEILDPEFLAANRKSRAVLKARFDELAAAGQVRFVTFHQSFSYEDFVEGLRASSEDGQVRYKVEPGLFKKICEDATAVAGMPTVDELLQRFVEQVAEEPVTLETARGKRFLVAHRYGNTTLTCIPEASESGRELPANIEHVRQILHGVRPDNIYCESYVRGIADFLRRDLPEQGKPEASGAGKKPFVLIIDEINRGNVSRIFGELITLIEENKRAGADEALSVVLPYSKERFSVPDNVYLIGTMNTADRSLAGLDIALRRRFTFREMPPRPELLDEVVVAGIDIGQLLRTMNERIEVLLDRDHCLGHAYFMPLLQDNSLERLATIFRNQVLPLLQEYFFEDWQRIQWVLNDHRKAAMDRFVYQSKRDLRALFGEEAEVSAHNLPWSINEEAFSRASAYAGIVAVQAKVAAPLGVPEPAEA